ncbi:hypothetical protein BASA83_008240 [Batrachochytrium salamandrivorans]|nr:hypothetical protein BASA83_008240 [Batrachochytrium salamandrivorans]
MFCGDYITSCDHFMEINDIPGPCSLGSSSYEQWNSSRRSSAIPRPDCETCFLNGDTMALASTYSKSRPISVKERVVFFDSQTIDSCELLIASEVFCLSMLEYFLNRTGAHCPNSNDSDKDYYTAQTDYRLLQFRLSGKAGIPWQVIQSDLTILQ